MDANDAIWQCRSLPARLFGLFQQRELLGRVTDFSQMAELQSALLLKKQLAGIRLLFKHPQLGRRSNKY